MPPPGDRTLRERKRIRTRAAIVTAAMELFEHRGYEGTTVADIAEKADIGTRTFFNYFTSKEEVVFPNVDLRVRAAVDAIAAREPRDAPADVLLRALSMVAEDGREMVGPAAELRMYLVRTVPAVRGRGLQLQQDAQREIAMHLHAAYPDELDEVSAAAIVGAFVGAVAGALQALTDGNIAGAGPENIDERRRLLRQATDLALRPWRQDG